MSIRLAATLCAVAALAACPAAPSPGTSDAAEPLDAGEADAGPATCPAGRRLQRDLTCAEVGWTQCPQGFEPEPSGWGCLDVQPAEDCPAGTMPVLGERSCQPVGWTDCGAGFAPEPSGWGCHEVLPASACQGATLEVLGEPECQPLGDCGAPFPPAEATHFVDAAYADGQVDGTHFRTISESLVAAPAGAVIAVESGTYLERLAVTVPVTVVGRCAEKVIVDGSQVGKSGILNRGVVGVEVRGLTLRKHVFGVSVSVGGTLKLEESVLEANADCGVSVHDAPSAVTLSRVAIRGTVVNAAGQHGYGMQVISGAKAQLNDVVLQANHGVGLIMGAAAADGTPAQVQAAGLAVRKTVFATSLDTTAVVVISGGRLTLDRGAVVDNPSTGLFVRDAQSQATLTHTIIRGTTWDGVQGLGVVAQGGGSLSLDSCGLLGNEGGALLSDEAGSQVTLARSLVVGASASGGGIGSGLSVNRGASLQADGVAVVRTTGYGALANEGGSLHASRLLLRENQGHVQIWSAAIVGGAARLDLDASALVANQGRGLTVQEGGASTLNGTIVRGTTELDASTTAAIMVNPTGALEINRSALVANAVMGLQVSYHGGAPATAKAADLVVRQTACSAQGNAGAGLAVFEGPFELSRALLLENHEIGVWLGTNSDTRLSNVVVLRTLANSSSRFGLGIACDRVTGLTVEDSAVVDARVAGMFLLSGGTTSVRRTLVSGVVPESDGRLGAGLFLLRGAAARLEESELSSSTLGLVVDESSLAVAGSVVRGNDVGLQVQHESVLSEVEEAPAAPVPLQVQVDVQTLILDNQSKVGAGTIPLPALPF
ncbi:MAG TPA: hypothetical protein VGK67_28595 [Myxococcales bacterium]|jgi:hypothetical protein